MVRTFQGSGVQVMREGPVWGIGRPTLSTSYAQGAILVSVKITDSDFRLV